MLNLAINQIGVSTLFYRLHHRFRLSYDIRLPHNFPHVEKLPESTADKLSTIYETSWVCHIGVGLDVERSFLSVMYKVYVLELLAVSELFRGHIYVG